jgi:hypothetical protein
MVGVVTDKYALFVDGKATIKLKGKANYVDSSGGVVEELNLEDLGELTCDLDIFQMGTWDGGMRCTIKFNVDLPAPDFAK